MYFRKHALLTTLLPPLFAVVAQGSPIYISAEDPCASELKVLDGSHQLNHQFNDKGSTVSRVEKLEIELEHEEVISLHTSTKESNDDDEENDQDLQKEDEKEQPEMKARDFARRTAVPRASPEHEGEQHEGDPSEKTKDAGGATMPTGKAYVMVFNGGHIMWTFEGFYTDSELITDRINNFKRYVVQHGAISRVQSESHMVFTLSENSGRYNLGFISAPDTGASGTNSDLIIYSAREYLKSDWKYEVELAPPVSNNQDTGRGQASGTK